MRSSLLTAAIAALSIVSCASGADAKLHRTAPGVSQVTQFCGTRYGSCEGTDQRAATGTRHTRNASRTLSPGSSGLAGWGGSATITSKKTGATARVDARYAWAFQSYVDELEADGARVLFMGGWRRGRCTPDGRHMHSCGGGEALDVCQRRRGVVDPRCGLPGRRAIASIAERHGLFEGGQWCNSDYGHAQVGVSAAACGVARHERRRRTKIARG
jgi:hypothetical protein